MGCGSRSLARPPPWWLRQCETLGSPSPVAYSLCRLSKEGTAAIREEEGGTELGCSCRTGTTATVCAQPWPSARERAGEPERGLGARTEGSKPSDDFGWARGAPIKASPPLRMSYSRN